MPYPIAPSKIFYPLPPGKPDPCQVRTAGEDLRQRVKQAAQKSGNTCWYSACNLIRERYGKNPDPAWKQERAAEYVVSTFRKQLTFSETLSSTREAQLEIIQQIEPSSDIPSVLHLCLLNERANREVPMQMQLLKQLDIDPENRYQTDIFPRLHDPWEQMPILRKRAHLAHLILRVVAERCYHFKTSPWHPTQKIHDLLSALRCHGPLLVTGCFGKSFYKTPPMQMPERLFQRTIWCWPSSAERKENRISHNIVVVGAQTTESRGGCVFFVDPSDGSDPKQPDLQRIYAISYQRLCENIVNLYGEHRRSSEGKVMHSADSSYALHGTLRIPPITE
jgi:hypothetical protein